MKNNSLYSLFSLLGILGNLFYIHTGENKEIEILFWDEPFLIFSTRRE
jgi:hypothetical protein